jgi:hypothetical protein
MMTRKYTLAGSRKRLQSITDGKKRYGQKTSLLTGSSDLRRPLVLFPHVSSSGGGSW